MGYLIALMVLFGFLFSGILIPIGHRATSGSGAASTTATTSPRPSAAASASPSSSPTGLF